MNIQAVTTQIKFYGQKLSEKLNEFYWVVSQKIHKAWKKGLSNFNRGDFSNG